MTASASPALAFRLALLCLFILPGCDRYPQDPNDSLENALQRDTLRIGVADSPPWVVIDADAPPGGAEGRLLAEFADELGVEVDWHRGGAQELLEALARYDLDIVAGGLSGANPWGAHVGFTLPYFTSRQVVGTPDPPLASLEGVVVTIHPLSSLREPLEERGAEVRENPELRDASGVIAGERWEVLATGREWAMEDLGETNHVLAVPPGENALLMRLEEFLQANADSMRVIELLQQEDAP